MFTAHYQEFKTQQQELHRQAAQYRLVRSLDKNSHFYTKIAGALGRLLIQSGQQLLNKAQAA